jgi:hypothetical protein
MKEEGGDNLTVFLVETYVIKPDKLGAFTALYKKFETYMKKRKDLFKEVKSHRIFSQLMGGNWGGYVEMTEFENFADFEKWMNKIMRSDYMTTLYPEFAGLEVPGKHTMNVWNPFP